jgi:threonine/homoserine/homoserine lactone efflux protein
VPDAPTLTVFALAALVLLVVPGPAVLYIVTQSVAHGRSAGLVSMLGIHLGTLVHVAAAAIGISALVVSSATAFSVVKYAGAAYLVVLGLRRLLTRPDVQRPEHSPPAPLRRLFLHGAVVNVLNPKTALFFLAFLPQFVDRDGDVALQVLVLGTVFVALGLMTDGAWAIAAGTAATWLRRSRAFVAGERYVSGTVFVGLGAASALAGAKPSS